MWQHVSEKTEINHILVIALRMSPWKEDNTYSRDTSVLLKPFEGTYTWPSWTKKCKVNGNVSLYREACWRLHRSSMYIIFTVNWVICLPTGHSETQPRLQSYPNCIQHHSEAQDSTGDLKHSHYNRRAESGITITPTEHNYRPITIITALPNIKILNLLEPTSSYKMTGFVKPGDSRWLLNSVAHIATNLIQF